MAENISSALADLAVTRSLLIARVANNLSNTTAKIYSDLIKDITLQVRSNPTEIQLKNLSKTISELQGLVGNNSNILEDELKALAVSEGAYTVASTNAVAGVDIFSKLPSESNLEKIYASSLMSSGSGAATIPKWFKSVDASMREDIATSMALGVVQGETNHQLATRLKSRLNITKGEAERIARTSSMQITNDARDLVYSENEDVISSYSYNSVLDSRSCLRCSSRDLTTYDMKGKGINTPLRKIPVPQHISCRCIYTVNLKSWEELGIPELSEMPMSTRSAFDGKVPANTTFDKWIKTKDDKFIETYLGKSRYKMYQDKNLSLSDFVNNKNEILTVKQLNEKYN